MLVGVAPGGINDISARLVAKHLGRFIPGNPAIVVQNNASAGGVVNANRLYNNTPKDGLTLAKFERAVPQLAVQGDPNAQYDPAKFVWLGSISSYADDAYLLTINASNPVTSIDEIKPGGGKSLTLGADVSASSNLIFASIAKEILGLNIKIVRGYTGAAHVPGHAERRVGRPVCRALLDQKWPARALQQGRVPTTDGVRPHHATS